MLEGEVILLGGSSDISEDFQHPSALYLGHKKMLMFCLVEVGELRRECCFFPLAKLKRLTNKRSSRHRQQIRFAAFSHIRLHDGGGHCLSKLSPS